MFNFFSVLNKIPKTILFFIAVALILVIGFIDFETGYEISISLFYLIPITLAAWFINRNAGIAAAVLSMFIWAFAEEEARGYTVPIMLLIWNATVRFGFFFVTASILSRLQTILEREKQQARIDYLTGIANSRFFYELAELELKRMRRYQRAFSVAYMDVDNFKSINDTFGHKRGDELLRMVAKLLKKAVRNIDIVARMGGDEFVLLLSEMDYNKAHDVLQRIKGQMQTEVQKSKFNVTFSIGATTYIIPPQSVDEMIKRADTLMYAAKTGGKNMIKHKVYNG